MIKRAAPLDAQTHLVSFHNGRKSVILRVPPSRRSYRVLIKPYHVIAAQDHALHIRDYLTKLDDAHGHVLDLGAPCPPITRIRAAIASPDATVPTHLLSSHILLSMAQDYSLSGQAHLET